MKQTIQLRLGQQLTMTPQLQQAIKLLQLSTLDLQQEIQQALESNLMLESADDDPPEQSLGDQGTGLEDISARDIERQIEDARIDDSLRPERDDMPAELPTDSQWADTFDSYTASGSAPSNNGSDGNDFDLFAQRSRPQTLHDHIDWQLNLTRFGERDRAVAEALIDAIDADGYLRLDLDELPDILNDPDLERDEIDAVLHRIQSFDPAGIAARDLRECLILQLRQLTDVQPQRDHALAICEHHFDALARNDLDSMRRSTKLGDDDLARALSLIRSLNPRPGSAVTEVRPEYIKPDVLVRRRNGRWTVELNPDTTPRIRVNESYRQLIRRADKAADNQCMKSHLQEAQWFIKSLLSRNDTVLRVASKIVELQQDFFDFGEEAMRPLVLRDIAETLELHESTVSRVTTQKYMHTPRGTLEFKYFFSSHVNTTSGGECSSTAIRAFIRKLVAAETPNKPLSDNKIADVLSDQGIKVARRTVAKYREAMGIPPSNERKRLA
ncbi:MULTISPECIES: RNA polymerase factor sigma-54 [Thiorhodovibrio]|uniref:RNA polymerase factor sigma-54 n=1 Tax=Thiorhodovibrio TaxID=61593 RepID=UPI001912217C|nr:MULTISPECIES: RNA polymerase factor sigma-54 [Thiorhodovibrio]MBK5967242.1 RNA polymerase factor sigma-54 [Thiorhodovibrio winogradskyi]WPL14504.1 RNA polymerase sigma-54 factor 1 [Thiorhodovibrio litoralis]